MTVTLDIPDEIARELAAAGEELSRAAGYWVQGERQNPKPSAEPPGPSAARPYSHRRRMAIMGHQFVNPDWSRLSPTKAVKRYQ
jgi:hypothetical protein